MYVCGVWCSCNSYFADVHSVVYYQFSCLFDDEMEEKTHIYHTHTDNNSTERRATESECTCTITEVEEYVTAEGGNCSVISFCFCSFVHMFNVFNIVSIADTHMQCRQPACVHIIHIG